MKKHGFDPNNKAKINQIKEQLRDTVRTARGTRHKGVNEPGLGIFLTDNSRKSFVNMAIQEMKSDGELDGLVWWRMQKNKKSPVLYFFNLKN